MAEERTLGIARALDRETDGEESSKEALQRRMELARDSITNTVTEIKENVTQQYENVKDALDWREHFKRQPVAWSLGAAGVGFFVGYGLAAAIRGDRDDDASSGPYATEYSPAARAYSAQPVPAEAGARPDASYGGTTRSVDMRATEPASAVETTTKEDGPTYLERFRETSAYERLSKEAGALGDRLVEELSTTAQQVVLPALLTKIKNWIGLDLSDNKERHASMGSQANTSSTYKTATDAGR